jgi:hypothetical protein
VVRGVRVVQAGTPERWGKDDGRQEKENAGDLKPEDAAHATERAEQTADALRDSASSLIGDLACRPTCRSS